MNAFEYAHSRNDIAWMAQNTNHLPTHPAIQEAIHKAADARKYVLYPLASGSPELRQEILDDLGLPDHAMHITNGGTEALYCMMRHLLPPGTQMVTTDPSYMIIHKFARLGGATTTDLPVYGGTCRYNIEAVKAAITPETRVLLLIDPLNPMGSSYPRDEVKALCDVAREHDLWLIDDITYRDYAFEHTLTTEFYPEKTLIAYSVSKNCGLAGLRVGALVAPPDYIAAIRPMMVSNLGINVVAQAAAEAALRTKPEWMPGLVKTARANQELIREAVEQVGGAHLPVFPSAASMMVIDIADTGIDPQVVEDKLLYEHQIFVRAGAYVSPTFRDRFVRLSFTIPTADVERFCEHFPPVMEELCASA